MSMRFATSVLALSLAASPIIAQTTANTTPGADTSRNGKPTRVREAAASAQDATTQSNINKAEIADLKKRVAALEAQVKDLQATSKK